MRLGAEEERRAAAPRTRSTRRPQSSAGGRRRRARWRPPRAAAGPRKGGTRRPRRWAARTGSTTEIGTSPRLGCSRTRGTARGGREGQEGKERAKDRTHHPARLLALGHLQRLVDALQQLVRALGVQVDEPVQVLLDLAGRHPPHDRQRGRDDVIVGVAHGGGWAGARRNRALRRRRCDAGEE